MTLTLPDGRVLPKPGNLFGVTESTLWGTYPEFTVAGVEADFNHDGKLDFGEALPDANVLKAGVDELDRYTAELLTKARGLAADRVGCFHRPGDHGADDE